MNIDKLLGSRTKTDILKYLVFKRQGVSMRALESEINWSFPAIKKQVDLLVEADILNIDKSNSKWSIYLNSGMFDLVKNIFMFSLKDDIIKLFGQYDMMVEKYFLGKLFGNKIEVDVVVVYKTIGKDFIEKIKEDISNVFVDYFVDSVGIVFMSVEDFQRRYRLADKFVLNLMTNCK